MGLSGFRGAYNVSSHNYDRLEEGMILGLKAQWIEPLSAGCNLGECYVVTADGFENMTRHTPIETFRVSAN
jgi:Xaa-Pro aminopeptidase